MLGRAGAVWADEPRRRSAVPTVVSRAEHKLAEAIHVFGLDLRAGMRAIDLGAAPGGWTFLLAERGLDVVAVDPPHWRPRLPTTRLSLTCASAPRMPSWVPRHSTC